MKIKPRWALLALALALFALIVLPGCAEEEPTPAKPEAEKAAPAEPQAEETAKPAAEEPEPAEEAAQEPASEAAEPEATAEPAEAPEEPADMAEETAEPAEKPEDDVPPVVAEVEGQEVTRGEFRREMSRLMQQLFQMGQPPAESDLPKIRKIALENLTNRVLLYQKAVEEGFQISEEEVQAKLEELKQRFPDEDAFQKALSRMELNLEDLEREIGMGLAVQNYIQEKYLDQIEITDEEAQEYYEANPEMFKQPEQVKARHILISVKPDATDEEKEEAMAKIEAIQERLAGGEEFAEVAQEVSEGPSKSAGGDLGFFGRGQMTPPFEKAAFELEPGEMSGVVETQFGYHLIKVEEKKPAGTTAFTEVKDRIKQFLKQNQVQKIVSEAVTELKKGAQVDILLPAEMLKVQIEEKMKEKLDKLEEAPAPEGQEDQSVREPAAAPPEEGRAAESETQPASAMEEEPAPETPAVDEGEETTAPLKPAETTGDVELEERPEPGPPDRDVEEGETPAESSQ